MRPPYVLRPFDAREALTVAQASKIANKSDGTIRNWCQLDDIGRRVANGPWQVSRVALSMLLDGDRKSLRAYLDGDRTSPSVVGYFRRHGLTPTPCGEG